MCYVIFQAEDKTKFIDKNMPTKLFSTKIYLAQEKCTSNLKDMCSNIHRVSYVLFYRVIVLGFHTRLPQ